MKTILLLKLVILSLISCTQNIDNDSPIFDDKLLMESNDSVAAYAIPNIVTTPKGTILCFATARIGDNHDWGNIQEIVLSRSFDEGDTWEQPKVIAAITNWTVRQTSVVVDPSTNKIIVFGHKSPCFNNKGERISETWNIANPNKAKEIGASRFIIESIDEGDSWTEIKEIELPYAPHDPGISLKYGKYKGRLVVPARTNKGTVFNWDSLYNGVIISDDNGETWRAGGLTQSHVGECCVVELSDGRIYVNSRNHSDNYGIRNHAISYDGGESFQEFGDDNQLIEPTCDAGMIRYSDPDDGNIILFSNPAVKATKRWDSESRRRMSVKASYDDCETWPINKLIYAGPSAYSGLAVHKNGLIFLIYERAALDSKESRENLAIARFNKSWLEKPNIEPPEFYSTQRVFEEDINIMMKAGNNSKIFFTLDGSKPDKSSKLFSDSIKINETVELKAIAYSDNYSSIISEVKFVKSKFKPPIYKTNFSEKYRAEGVFTLIDGLEGGLNYNDGRWQGIEKNDLDVVLDLGSKREVEKFSIRFLQSIDFWIFYPERVIFSVSDDNINFRQIKILESSRPNKDISPSIHMFKGRFTDLYGRYFRIVAKNIGTCPSWHKGAGGDAWLFADELTIE